MEIARPGATRCGWRRMLKASLGLPHLGISGLGVAIASRWKVRHIPSTVRGHGIGSELLKELVARAKTLGKHSMLAGVDSETTASLRLLERFGFERVGYLPEVGYKFGRFLDLAFPRYALEPPSCDMGRSGAARR